MSSSNSSKKSSSGAGLALRHVRKNFGGTIAVDVKELDVPNTGVTALIGPNGAGKTTLFDIVSGFVKPSAGDITFAGDAIADRSPDWRAKRGLVRTFQLTRVFDRMTVLENMLIGVLPDRHLGLTRSTLMWRSSRRAERQAAEKARALLAQVGLERKADLLGRQLSGGQKKLLEFSRSLMTDPTLLLLDEPLAGVNPAIRERMLEHITAFVSTDRGVMFVEHDLPRVMQIADRVVVLDRGSVIADGAPRVIAEDPQVIKAYLGGAAR